MRAARLILLFAILSAYHLRAQRSYEEGSHVVFEDTQGRKTSLGRGHDPVPVSDDTILLIRGAHMGYGDRFACTKPESKNWVSLYDTTTRRESVVYNKPLPNAFLGKDDACVFEHADLSPDRSTLYVVTPWAATAGLLAIINLKTGRRTNVGGVNEVYVIRGGPSEGELIYSRRTLTKAGGRRRQPRLLSVDPRKGRRFPNRDYLGERVASKSLFAPAARARLRPRKVDSLNLARCLISNRRKSPQISP